MAHTESDREDLMRDAAALRIRGEFRVPDSRHAVVAGCRDNGNWSIYFGPDPCYHFDPRGRLRRAYVDDRLYRTQGATLGELRRVRSDDATHLMRRDLDASELESFVTEMQQRLARVRDALQSGTATLVQAVPEDAEVDKLLTQFLGEVVESPPALAPPIKTRRH